MRPPPAKPLTRLKVTDDRGFAKTVLIDKDVFPIGREAAGGLALPGEGPETMASTHALVIRDGGTCVLKDQSGPRGTRVNGRPIRSTVLRHGDEIRLGSSALKIEFLVEGTRASDLEEARIRRLLEMLRELHASPDAKEVCARVAAGITGLIGSAWAAVALADATGGLQMVAAIDRTGTLPGSPSGIALHVAATARPYFHPVRLCVPVNGPGHEGTQGKLLGVIDAGPREATPYQADDMQLLESLAGHVGVALTNARRLSTAPPEASPASQEAAAR